MGSNPNDQNFWKENYLTPQDRAANPTDLQRSPGHLWTEPTPTTFQQPTMLPSNPVEFAPGAQWVGPGGDWFLNVLFVGVLWEVWVCLYPLAALAGLLTLLYSMPLLRRLLPPSPIIGPGLYAVVLGFVAAAVVLWSVSRLEHVLARFGFYRILRHVVRLPLLGLATVVVIQKLQGLPYDLTLAGITPILKAPANLAIVVGVMIASHFILWNWKWAREFWHRRLASAQLRKRDT
jgi:hypothetical protein